MWSNKKNIFAEDYKQFQNKTFPLKGFVILLKIEKKPQTIVTGLEI